MHHLTPLGFAGIIIESEIQHAYAINRLKLIIPLPAFRLLLNGKCAVKYRAILEEILFRFL